MKHLNMLAISAIILMAFAGTASATVTSPAGTAYNGEFKATSTNFELDGSIDAKCTFWEARATFVAGLNTAAVSHLTTSGCHNDTVTVVKKGHLTLHSNGNVTWNGPEFKVQLHRSIFGLPITTHCIYAPAETSIGTLTEGVAPAVIHLSGANIPQKATDGACGENAQMTGTFTVEKPSSAIVVD